MNCKIGRTSYDFEHVEGLSWENVVKIRNVCYYKNTWPMMMIGHVGWFILACIVHILKHLTSQNEVKDGKINTCETSMSLALPFCRSKLPSSVS